MEDPDRTERDAQYRAEARTILVRIVGYEYWKTEVPPADPRRGNGTN